MATKVGVLKFDLGEYQNEFNIAVKAMNYVESLWDLDQYLRDKIKYFDDNGDLDYDTLQSVRDTLYDIMSDNGVSFDDYM